MLRPTSPHLQHGIAVEDTITATVEPAPMTCTIMQNERFSLRSSPVCNLRNYTFWHNFAHNTCPRRPFRLAGLETIGLRG